MTDLLLLIESNTTGTGWLFVERARALGLQPVLVSADPQRYRFAGELEVLRCDTGSPAGVLAALDARFGRSARPGLGSRIVGVTSSSEYYTSVAALLARTIGLPGENPAAVQQARDKARQRAVFAAAGVGSTSFAVATDPELSVREATALGFPVVVKPIDRSGSIGVRRCDGPGEVRRHARALLAGEERLLVERYLPGPEFSVEVLAGVARAVVGKYVDESRGFVETGHDVPAVLDPYSPAGPILTERALTGTALAAVSALGLGWGAAHVELRLTPTGPVVIEVNPRLAGGMIPEVVRFATGEDLIVELIARSCGLPVPSPATAPARHASIRFVLPGQDGTVLAVPEIASVLGAPGVVAAAVTAEPGMTIRRQGTFADRVGYVIAVGADAGEAAGRAAVAARRLAARLRLDDRSRRPVDVR